MPRHAVVSGIVAVLIARSIVGPLGLDHAGDGGAGGQRSRDRESRARKDVEIGDMALVVRVFEESMVEHRLPAHERAATRNAAGRAAQGRHAEAGR